MPQICYNMRMLPVIDRKESDYAVAAVSEFAQRKCLSLKEAFRYLLAFKGIEFLRDFYDVEHTLSFDNVVEDLTQVCHRNGGVIE